jgi:hypothetical protein
MGSLADAPTNDGGGEGGASGGTTVPPDLYVDRKGSAHSEVEMVRCGHMHPNMPWKAIQVLDNVQGAFVSGRAIAAAP